MSAVIASGLVMGMLGLQRFRSWIFGVALLVIFLLLFFFLFSRSVLGGYNSYVGLGVEGGGGIG